jgi:hypothetical protein
VGGGGGKEEKAWNPHNPERKCSPGRNQLSVREVLSSLLHLQNTELPPGLRPPGASKPADEGGDAGDKKDGDDDYAPLEAM